MARRWRDLVGATIALLLLESHHLAQLSLSKRIHCLTQISRRLMGVNTRHPYRRVTS